MPTAWGQTHPSPGRRGPRVPVTWGPLCLSVSLVMLDPVANRGA